jgi:hypothetical protein
MRIVSTQLCFDAIALCDAALSASAGSELAWGTLTGQGSHCGWCGVVVDGERSFGIIGSW